MKVEIKYKYNGTITTVSGIARDWINYSRKLKEGRVLPYYLPNEFTFDNWNNKEFSIQDKIWETYFFDFEIQELENLELNVINSADEINIIQYNSRNGTVILKTYNVDVTKSDYFQISQPELLGGTTGAKTSIIFRTNRTIVNKGGAVLNTNRLIINSVSYYSDFDLLKWNKPEENINVPWSDGSERLLQSTNKTGYQVLLYLNNSDLETFIGNVKTSTTNTINTIPITEIEYDLTEIGENYNKIIIKGVASTNVINFDVSPSSTYDLQIIDTQSTPVTHNFYTDFIPKLISEAPVKSTFANSGGINNNARNISKTVKQLTFFMTETNAFELKKRFELGGTITIDSVPVLESRAVTPELIGTDVYKINIDCLISTTKSY